MSRLIDDKGEDLGEITQVDYYDECSPEMMAYIVYVYVPHVEEDEN